MNEAVARRTRRSREMRRRARRRKRILTLVTAATVMLLAIFALSGGTGSKATEPGGESVQYASTAETFAIPLVYTMEHYDEGTVDLPITKQQTDAQTEPVMMPEPFTPLPYTAEDVEALCKAVYGEALVTQSDMEMSAVVWCVLNRMDSDRYDYGSIYEAVTAPSQFHGYDIENPVTEHIEWLVLDVLSRWMEEKAGAENVGRTLPADYLFFWGDGWHNHYTTEYHGDDYWDWSLPNPYDT